MISSKFQNTLARLQHTKVENDEAHTGPLVSVENIAKHLGVLYEKLRYLVDYKEEHTIRRAAIRRVLRRVLFLEGISQPGLIVLRELVGGGYAPNNHMPESWGARIDTIVEKYSRLCDAGLDRKTALDFSAIEIERFLYPNGFDEIITDYFFDSMSPHIGYAETASDDITYVGCRRALLAEDRSALLFALVNRATPDLVSVGNNPQSVQSIASRVLTSLRAAQATVKDSRGWHVAAALKNHGIYFSLIREIVVRYGMTAGRIFDDKNEFERVARDILREKYARQHRTLVSSGNRAVGYLLLTKIILAGVLELPYEYWVLGSVNVFALGTNALFHPLLLLAMVKSVSAPNDANTSRIIAGIRDIIEWERVDEVFVRSSIRGVMLGFVAVLYLALFAVSFGVLAWVLAILGFNVVSVGLFFLFLALVGYFGIRVRHNAGRWTLRPAREGFFRSVWNLLTLPIVRTGGWLSRKFSSVNIFVVLLDFFVEMPFKFFVSVLDAFLLFVKEQRADYVE